MTAGFAMMRLPKGCGVQLSESGCNRGRAQGGVSGPEWLELVDAGDSKSPDRKVMRVRFPPPGTISLRAARAALRRRVAADERNTG